MRGACARGLALKYYSMGSGILPLRGGHSISAGNFSLTARNWWFLSHQKDLRDMIPLNQNITNFSNPGRKCRRALSHPDQEKWRSCERSFFSWSGCRDSNPESCEPESQMLAVTPHPVVKENVHIDKAQCTQNLSYCVIPDLIWYPGFFSIQWIPDRSPG